MKLKQLLLVALLIPLAPAYSQNATLAPEKEAGLIMYNLHLQDAANRGPSGLSQNQFLPGAFFRYHKKAWGIRASASYQRRSWNGNDGGHRQFADARQMFVPGPTNEIGRSWQAELLAGSEYLFTAKKFSPYFFLQAGYRHAKTTIENHWGIVLNSSLYDVNGKMPWPAATVWEKQMILLSNGIGIRFMPSRSVTISIESGYEVARVFGKRSTREIWDPAVIPALNPVQVRFGYTF